MKIAGTANPFATSRLQEVDATDSAAPAGVAPAKAASSPSPLQTAVLQPAIAALGQMPDIDLERVAELRDALARGEVPFDAAKLAGLIQRFHGSKA